MSKPKLQSSAVFTPAGEDRCNGTALRKATRRVSQLYDAALTPAGLRGTQFAILMRVGRAGGLNVTDLAAALVLNRSALAHNLKPLERDGLVAVTIDDDDRRNRIVTLTAAGRARLEQAEALWRSAQGAFEAAYGKRKAAELRAALALIASADFSDAFERARALSGAVL